MRSPTAFVVVVAFVAALLSPFVARATSRRTDELRRGSEIVHGAVAHAAVIKSRLRAAREITRVGAADACLGTPHLTPLASVVAAAVLVGVVPIVAPLHTHRLCVACGLDRSRGPPFSSV